MRITEKELQRFVHRLRQEEKSAATIEKYRREAARFVRWLDGREAVIDMALAYKAVLAQERTPAGVNGAVAALNRLFSFLGLDECRLKAVKVQRRIFSDEARELTRAEYRRLLDAAKRRNNRRLLLVMETICATGIRVSECVGLDITDINFRENSIRIVRKGGNESILYFGDEVEKALLDYIEGPRAMMAMKAVPGEENTLFFSLQKKRISVHAVENLVEKYAKEFVPHKKITPHKLRSTFGTNLYQETGDIYLVADVLGHKDVNTTKKHYADMLDETKRRARNAVKLREK